MEPRAVYLCLQGWAGLSKTTVLLVGETPKRYRIRAISRTKLAGRCRWINPEETALVPKHSIQEIKP